MKIAPAIYVTLAVIAALWITKTCAYRSGRADERLIAKDDSLNAVIVAQREHADSAAKIFDAAQDSVGREIRRLLQRIAGGRPATPQPPGSHGADSTMLGVDEAASAPLRLRDSLIAVLLDGRRADSLQIVFWRATVAQRDSVVTALQASRDVWRKLSERKFGCTGGLSVSGGFGGTAVGLGFTCGLRIL